jgi:hypothetical protein
MKPFSSAIQSGMKKTVRDTIAVRTFSSAPAGDVVMMPAAKAKPTSRSLECIGLASWVLVLVPDP